MEPMKNYPCTCYDCGAVDVYRDLVTFEGVKFPAMKCRTCGAVYFSGNADAFMRCLINPPDIDPAILQQTDWRAMAKAFRQGIPELHLTGCSLQDDHLVLNGDFYHCGTPVSVEMRAPAKSLLHNMSSMSDLCQKLKVEADMKYIRFDDNKPGGWPVAVSLADESVLGEFSYDHKGNTPLPWTFYGGSDRNISYDELLEIAECLKALNEDREHNQ